MASENQPTPQEQIFEAFRRAQQNPVGRSHMAEISRRVSDEVAMISSTAEYALQKYLIIKNINTHIEKKLDDDFVRAIAEYLWKRINRNETLLAAILANLNEVANYVGVTNQPSPLIGKANYRSANRHPIGG